MGKTSAELPFFFGTENTLNSDLLGGLEAAMAEKYTPSTRTWRQQIAEFFRRCNFDVYTFLIVTFRSIGVYCLLYAFGLVGEFGFINGITTLFVVNVLAGVFVLAALAAESPQSNETRPR